MSQENGAAKAAVHGLALSSIVAFATYSAGVAVTYLCQLVIARAVGVESYGIYSYVVACITLLAYLAALGFDVSLLRLVAAYRTQGMWDLARGAIQYAERRSAVMGIGIALLGLATVSLARSRQTQELTQAFVVGFAIVPVLALLWIRAAVVRAFGGVFSALAPDRLVRDGLLLVFVGCLVLGGSTHIGAPAVLTATLVSAFVGLGLVSWAKRRWSRFPKGGPPPAYAAREWRRATIPLVVIAVAEAAINRTGVISLGWVGHTADAGIYALVFNVTSVVVLPRIAVNTRFAPMVSELFVQRDQSGLQELIARTASWTLMGAAAIALPLFFLAEPVLAWFGSDFRAAVLPMRVLLVSQVIAASAGSQIFLMTMTGQERSAAIIVVLAALGNYVLTVPLIHLFGTTGAAIANAITLLLWNAAMGILIYRRLGVAPGMMAILLGRRTAAKHRDAAGLA